MKHIFRPGSREGAPVLLLLHGTGGTEQDLIPLAQVIDATAPVLAVRGNVLENGMARFFRRLAEGVFDEEDLVFRTNELHEHLNQWSKEYGFDRQRVVGVGYSNGANIAGSLLFHVPGALAGAILHHPMVPRRGIDLPDLTGTPVFIGAGRNDPICSPQETEELAQLLQGAGAEVEVYWEEQGHRLTPTEAQVASEWYRKRFGAAEG